MCRFGVFCGIYCLLKGEGGGSSPQGLEHLLFEGREFTVFAVGLIKAGMFGFFPPA